MAEDVALHLYVGKLRKGVAQQQDAQRAHHCRRKQHQQHLGGEHRHQPAARGSVDETQRHLATTGAQPVEPEREEVGEGAHRQHQADEEEGLAVLPAQRPVLAMALAVCLGEGHDAHVRGVAPLHVLVGLAGKGVEDGLAGLEQEDGPRPVALFVLRVK